MIWIYHIIRLNSDDRRQNVLYAHTDNVLHCSIYVWTTSKYKFYMHATHTPQCVFWSSVEIDLDKWPGNKCILSWGMYTGCNSGIVKFYEEDSLNLCSAQPVASTIRSRGLLLSSVSVRLALLNLQRGIHYLQTTTDTDSFKRLLNTSICSSLLVF